MSSTIAAARADFEKNCNTSKMISAIAIICLVICLSLSMIAPIVDRVQINKERKTTNDDESGYFVGNIIAWLLQGCAICLICIIAIFILLAFKCKPPSE